MFVLLFTRLASQGILCYTFQVYCRAVMSLPCVKGGGSRERDGGIVKIISSTNNPSVSCGDSSLPEGAFGLCVPKVRLLFLTSTSFVDTKAKLRTRRGKNYKVKRALNSSRSRRASKSFQVRYSLKSSVKVDVPLQVKSFES